MESQRQEKVNRLIQRDLGAIFQKEGPALSKAMVTVTKVKVTPDLALARVYLSLFGIQDKEAELDLIRHKTKEIRYKLGQKVKNQLRAIPQLEFHEDDSLDYIDRIEDLLEK